MNRKPFKLIVLVLGLSLTTGCFPRPVIVVTATPSQLPAPTVTPTELPTIPPPAQTIDPTTAVLNNDPPTLPPDTPTAAPNAVRLWIAPDVPPTYQATLDPLVRSGRYAWASEAEAQVKLITAPPGSPPISGLSAQWLYVPVVPFPTVADDVKWVAIQRYWNGDVAALSSLSNTKQPPKLILSPATLTAMTALLGPPNAAVKIEQVPPDALVTTLWLRRPAAWAIVPFAELDPAMKALTLDGASVFNRDLDLNTYPLVQHFTLTGDPALVAAASDAINASGKWIASNRDLSKLTILVMTGVTAMGRATAFQMEKTGITLPARDILPFLSDADLVHTSNEVAFATDCPFPDPAYTDTTKIHFCSKDSYFDLLKAIHLGVVELTGNHVNDWGTDAFTHTLDLYDANKIPYFGGGRNTEDARKGIVLTVNGNRIAFVGCNPVGPAPAWAKPDRVGAAKCDEDFLAKEIPRLKTIADVVIMTIQYDEYYQYDVPDDQVSYFHKFADMGADLVMGSQAHWPQGFAFTDKTFIHYGIGNLFFDQMDQLGTRQMFADKLMIYNGKHISTVLFTGLLEDYSRPRPMTPDERTDFLQTIFKASGW